MAEPISESQDSPSRITLSNDVGSLTDEVLRAEKLVFGERPKDSTEKAVSSSKVARLSQQLKVLKGIMLRVNKELAGL